MQGMRVRGIYRVVALVITLAIFPSVSMAEGESVELDTPVQAMAQALAYCGFENLRKFSQPSAATSTEKTTVVDTTTPFLSDRISGEGRWVVTFDSVYLEMDSVWSEKNHARQLQKTYKAYLDPETGQLLKIVGRHVY